MELSELSHLNIKIAVVIPCYRVTKHILNVIHSIGPDVHKIYVIDDCCPDSSGDLVSKSITDSRVKVIWHANNLGVGGAVMTGYREAIADNMSIVVKIDGDDQMDAGLIPNFVFPIAIGKADYTKGNRFFELENIMSMPKIRIFGNAALSFMTKASSGYWDVFDPTNGYTAIHVEALRRLPLQKISTNYFFESDMLFRLNILRAVVLDIPMKAKYADEISSLKISNVIGSFLISNIRNFAKRIFYNYYLRGMSPASIELPLGLALLSFGICFGAYKWYQFGGIGHPTPFGTIMIATLTILMGFQLLLAFLAYDVANVPRHTLEHEFFNTRNRHGK